MGSPIQATMFFKQDNSGWSEVLTMNPSVFPDLGSANAEVTKKQGLGQLRVQLLGQNASLIGIRLSKFGIWRDSNYTAATPNNPPAGIWIPSWSYSKQPCVNPWDVQTVRLECSDSYRRLVYLSGIPDSVYSVGDFPLWPADYRSAFADYVNYLTGQKTGSTPGAYGTMVSSKNTSDPPSPNINLAVGQAPTYAVVNNQGQLTLSLTGVVTGLTTGAKVRILGVKARPGTDARKWNGIFRVVNPLVGASFTVATKVSPTPFDISTLDFSQAYVWVPQPQFVAFTDWEIDSKTHRKRGVAFGTPRGRSKIRR